jgi:hypothetical protein
MWGLFDNVVALYEALDIKPTMVDGDTEYPDDEHKSSNGMAIQFRRVTRYNLE